MHFLAHRKIRLTVMFAAVAASAFVGGAQGMPRAAHAPDSLVVKFKSGVAASDMERAERAAQVKEISSIRPLGVDVMSVAPNHIDAALARSASRTVCVMIHCGPTSRPPLTCVCRKPGMTRRKRAGDHRNLGHRRRPDDYRS
jgi:Fervidolysin N-terminal prodomain